MPEAHPFSAAPRRSFLRQTLADTIDQWGARFGLAWIGLIAVLAVLAPYIASTHPIAMKLDGRWSSPMWNHLTAADWSLTVFVIAGAVLGAVRRGTWASAALDALLVLMVASPLIFIPRSEAASWHRTLLPEASPALRVTCVALCAIAWAGVVTGAVIRWWRGGRIATFVMVAVLGAFFLTCPVQPPETVNYQGYRDLERSGRITSVVRTIIPYSPSDRLRDQPEQRLSSPSLDHWLGTETDGADLLSRMIHATRISLSIGLISTSIATLLGIVIGGLMGYYFGKIDLIGMRLIEVFEAIPTLLILITIMAAYGRSIYMMMAVIGLLSWTGTARFIRAEFLRLRNQDFVQAAVASGLRQTTIIYRHILPNGLTPVLVTATFGVASAILTEATLSFLGLGLIDEPSWGQMLNQARSGGQGFVWWMAIFPGLAIFLTVYAYALIGDAVRDALDPKLKKRD